MDADGGDDAALAPQLRRQQRRSARLAHTILLRDTGLTVTQYGWTISAFSAAYLVGNPTWGLLLDRVGVRRGLVVAVALWTMRLGVARVRGEHGRRVRPRPAAALGFGEGATFPGGLCGPRPQSPLRPDQRARGVALAYSGGSLGAVLTPLVIVSPIALRRGDGAAPFLCTGLLRG